MSPSYSKGIGLGYVSSDYSQKGEFIFVKIREKFIKSKIVKLPFKA